MIAPFAAIQQSTAATSKTREAIFATPTAAALEWARVEALRVAVGCRVIEGHGSLVRFARGLAVSTFHRPHPAKEAKPYLVEAARELVELIGVRP